MVRDCTKKYWPVSQVEEPVEVEESEIAQEPTVEKPQEPFAPQEIQNADTNKDLVNETLSLGKFEESVSNLNNIWQIKIKKQGLGFKTST